MTENFFPRKTTLEMDGIFTKEDISNRYYVMVPCNDCDKWCQMDVREKKFSCSCGGTKYDIRDMRSLRTWHAGLKKTKKKK